MSDSPAGYVSDSWPCLFRLSLFVCFKLLQSLLCFTWKKKCRTVTLAHTSCMMVMMMVMTAKEMCFLSYEVKFFSRSTSLTAVWVHSCLIQFISQTTCTSDLFRVFLIWQSPFTLFASTSLLLILNLWSWMRGEWEHNSSSLHCFIKVSVVLSGYIFTHKAFIFVPLGLLWLLS